MSLYDRPTPEEELLRLIDISIPQAMDRLLWRTPMNGPEMMDVVRSTLIMLRDEASRRCHMDLKQCLEFRVQVFVSNIDVQIEPLGWLGEELMHGAVDLRYADRFLDADIDEEPS